MKLQKTTRFVCKDKKMSIIYDFKSFYLKKGEGLLKMLMCSIVRVRFSC